MEEYVVSLNNIVKKYKDTTAVDQVNLQLKAGEIYGLVGKNGAGKTTMMRIIAGLAIPTKGSIEISAGKIGTLIEAPGLINNISAKANLKYYRMLMHSSRTRNDLTHNTICKNEHSENTLSDNELLDLVGLDHVGKKRVKDFSLGTRQRLGIAIALLGNPSFVMLDEPINGLDPVGVIEMRNLIKKLNQEKGMTILISSHNLPELFQTATDYIIMDKGIVKKETSHDELATHHKENLEEYFLSIINEGSDKL